jgi:hypothetical protein
MLSRADEASSEAGWILDLHRTWAGSRSRCGDMARPTQSSLGESGCHLNREVDQLIEAAGFQITELKTGYLPGPRPLTNYQGLGTAEMREQLN